MINPNTAALIKLANAYDMYDHQNYAKRHNKNNPKYLPLDVNVVRKDDSDNIRVIKYEPTVEFPGMPKIPQNTNAPVWSKEQTHVYKRQPSVNGTGGGPPYGSEHRNPFAKP